MRQKVAIFLMVVGCVFFSFLSSDAYANIVIKVRALNPLETEEIASILYPLPEEISPDDIVAKNITFSLPQEEEAERKDTFNVEYVEEEGRYFIIDEVVMGPREVVTLAVHVNDIWTIPAHRLQSIKQAVEALIARYPPVKEPSSDEDLSGSGEEPESVEEGEEVEEVDEVDGETIMILQDEIFEQIDEIAARQPESSVLKVGVEKHMEAYYENMEALAQVEADVEMLRYLLEPEEEEGEESEEGEGGTEEEAHAQEELPVEAEIPEEDIPLADPVAPVSEDEDGVLEPEIDIVE